MPAISRFHGIVNFLNYNDHSPPNFHARCRDEEVTVTIDTGLVQGRMSGRGLQRVLDWSVQHQPELRVNWDRARDYEPLLPIPPLP